MDYTDHPQISAALATGYPDGRGDNGDSPAARLDYAREHVEELLDFLLAGEEKTIDAFISHYSWSYRSWLN